ncbi:hypothetical protein LXL04_023765 [Taraxacum kok-saghyz]
MPPFMAAVPYSYNIHQQAPPPLKGNPTVGLLVNSEKYTLAPPPGGIWDHIFRWLQIPSFGVLSPKEILDWVEECRLRSNQKKSLEVVVCAALWILWRYRNDVIHESRKMRKGVILDCIKEFSFVWFRNRQHKVVVSWTDWLQQPLNVL